MSAARFLAMASQPASQSQPKPARHSQPASRSKPAGRLSGSKRFGDYDGDADGNVDGTQADKKKTWDKRFAQTTCPTSLL